MHRLYWFFLGMIAGAFTYRYLQEGGEIPGFESLGEGTRRLSERGREFAESGRKFAESGKQLAQEGRTFARTAADTAQSRGRDVMDTVKTQANKLTGNESGERMREDVAHEPGSAS